MNEGAVAPMEGAGAKAMSDGIMPERSTRFSVDAEVQLGRVRAEEQVSGRVLEVGTDGCLLRFPAPVDFELHTPIEVVMRVGIAKIRSLGSVDSISESRCELEVKFVEMGGRGRADLEALLHRLPLVKPKLAEPELELEEAAPEIRRRKHRRYRLEAEVFVAYTGSLMQFPGMTANLSTGGCLVQFKTLCDLSLGSEVELWVQTGMGMFKVTGRLRRRTRDQYGLGVEFEGSSTRSLREVEKLVAACIREEALTGRTTEAGRVEDRVTA